MLHYMTYAVNIALIFEINQKNKDASIYRDWKCSSLDTEMGVLGRSKSNCRIEYETTCMWLFVTASQLYVLLFDSSLL